MLCCQTCCRCGAVPRLAVSHTVRCAGRSVCDCGSVQTLLADVTSCAVLCRAVFCRGGALPWPAIQHAAVGGPGGAICDHGLGQSVLAACAQHLCGLEGAAAAALEADSQ